MTTHRKRNPHRHKRGTTECWWYENARSIDVYLRSTIFGGDAITCRIPRAELADYIKRTEPKK